MRSSQRNRLLALFTILAVGVSVSLGVVAEADGNGDIDNVKISSFSYDTGVTMIVYDTRNLLLYYDFESECEVNLYIGWATDVSVGYSLDVRNSPCSLNDSASGEGYNGLVMYDDCINLSTSDTQASMELDITYPLGMFFYEVSRTVTLNASGYEYPYGQGECSYSTSWSVNYI